MIALYWRDAAGGGEGQVIDLSLSSRCFGCSAHRRRSSTSLASVQGRQRQPLAVQRPAQRYQTADGRWVAMSGGTQQIAERMMQAIGRPELAEDPRFKRLRRASREHGRDGR